jgi:hypothetical protein
LKTHGVGATLAVAHFLVAPVAIFMPQFGVIVLLFRATARVRPYGIVGINICRNISNPMNVVGHDLKHIK